MRLYILPLLLAAIISLSCDWYILRQIRHKGGRRAYVAGTAALYLMLIVALLMPRRGEGSILPVMWMLYGFLTILIPKVIYVLLSLIGRIPRLWHGRSLHLGMLVGIPAGVIVFGAMWWGALLGRRQIQVNDVTIASERIPAAYDGYRIVQFSDMHVGTWGGDTTFVSEFVDSINALHPDLIVFTGDIVNRRTDELQPFLSVLKRLRARDGVYSILGNHDYGDYFSWPSAAAKRQNLESLKQMQAQMGWKMLNNGHAFLTADTDTMVLIGVENVGEPPFTTYGDLGKAYPMQPTSRYNCSDSLFKILLSHNPEHWVREVSGKTNIDLTLSGHTHAMQLMLKLGRQRWSPSQYKYKYWGGLYSDDDGQQLYVNIGGGEVGMPYRIGAAPEITVLTLKRSER